MGVNDVRERLRSLNELLDEVPGRELSDAIALEVDRLLSLVAPVVHAELHPGDREPVL